MRLATLPRRRDCRRRRRHVAATLADGAQARRPYPRRRGARSLEVAVADRGLAQARAGSRRSVQQAQAARRERSRSPIFAMRTAAVPAHLSLWPRAHAAWTSAAPRLIRRRATTTDRRLLAPTQMAAEWPAQLDGVAHLRHVMEEGGDLAVVEPLDGELDARGILRRGRDGVAAFCAIAVRRGQPHIDMLPSAEGKRRGRLKREALHPRRDGRRRSGPV